MSFQKTTDKPTYKVLPQHHGPKALHQLAASEDLNKQCVRKYCLFLRFGGTIARKIRQESSKYK
jgi:hypothetical protein